MSEQKSKFSDGFNEAFRSGRFMGANPRLSPLSVSSVMLEMLFNDTLLAKGTGWFWRLPAGTALVTAWHNFAGLHHTLRRPISAHGGMPNRVRYRYMAKIPQTFQDAEVPLFMDVDCTQPRWFVHPQFGSFFDMAFLLLGFTGGEVFCVNDTVEIQPEDGIRPGHDIFAIGYPQGVNTLGLLPTWKRGSVASEPQVPVDGHPKFYVDLVGRGGLSGAPVFRVQHGVVTERRGSEQVTSFGEKTELVGLYSGRAADQLPPEMRDGESTDLGFVWRPEFIMEMLSGLVLDELPEIGKGKMETREIWEKR